MIASQNFPAPGTKVGCSYRWPYRHFHPDCWMPPHKGIVLAMDDPRAWNNSAAFPRKMPTQEECTKHVQDCLKRGLLKGTVPVLWTSSLNTEEFMQWDHSVRPYAEELAAWEQARKDAYSSNNLANSDVIKKEWSAEEGRIGKYVNLDQDTLNGLIGVPLKVLNETIRSILSRK